MDTYSMQEYDATQVNTLEDVILVARLANEIWHECYKDILDRSQILYMIEHIQSENAIQERLEQGDYYFIIWYEGSAVGYYSVKVLGSELFLSKLYLKAKVQGSGIGRAALAEIMRFCVDKGCNSIRLTVNKYNTKAIKFYQKAGFETVDSVKTPIGEGYIMDDYIMVKSIEE